MKRITLLLAVLLLLSACDGTPDVEETPSPPPDSPTGFVTVDAALYADHLVYPADAARFAVDENGVAYTYDPNHQKIDPETGYFINPITAYGLDGVKITEYPAAMGSSSIGSMCAGGGKLYAVTEVRVNSRTVIGLHGLDLDTREVELLTTFDNFIDWNHTKIAYSDGRVYILAKDPEYADKGGALWSGDIGYESFGYRYEGTVLAAYHIAEDAAEIIFDGEIHNFSVAPNGTVILLAHDSIGGFYFTELDPAAMTTGERIYRRTRMIDDFCADGAGVIYSQPSAMAGNSLKYNSLAEDSGVIEMLSGAEMNMFSAIVYNNGFTFFQSSGKLERIKNSAYMKDAPPVRMILIGSQLTNVSLYADGFNVAENELGYNEMALTVLSRDIYYDICKVYSNSDFAANLKDKGSFYPLNGVPGVREYLDACFPFVRDAATDRDGNIWMLPVEVQVNAIIYHDGNCLEAGIGFTGADAVYDIIDIVKRARDRDASGSNYCFNPNYLLRHNLTAYLRDTAVLETPEFRQMAAALKDFMAEEDFWGSSMAAWTPSPFNPEFLFDNWSSQTDLTMLGRDDLYAASHTGPNVPGSAYGVFLCVNPDSNNLDNTLAYISALCGNLAERRNSFMLTDPSLYTDSGCARSLYALYQNSVIDFTISDEVFMDDFDRYLNGKITLDELIKEAGRKLAMYLGE